MRHEIVGEQKMFGDVLYGPRVEVEVQQALVAAVEATDLPRELHQLRKRLQTRPAAQLPKLPIVTAANRSENPINVQTDAFKHNRRQLRAASQIQRNTVNKHCFVYRPETETHNTHTANRLLYTVT